MEPNKSKDLLANQKTDPLNEVPLVQQANKNIFDYENFGFTEAGKSKGTIEGLNLCWHQVYQDYKKGIRDNIDLQNKEHEKYKTKIENKKIDKDKLERDIEKITKEDIPELKNKISTLKEDISEIRSNPKIIIDDYKGKAGLYISGFILFWLTVFLFVFYSSASYSAFFKQFSVNDIGVANSIFDPSAVKNAYEGGITELLLILLVPFIFLGLGFLIHMFNQKKGIQGYLKSGILLLVSFLFDFIIAYEITQRIYDVKKSNSFGGENIPDYSIALAFGNLSFWLIIFSGFVAYVIWGLLFDSFMDGYGKSDKVFVAINEKEKKIGDIENGIKDLEDQKKIKNTEVSEIKKEINNLIELSNCNIYPLDDIKGYLTQFFRGWSEWMSGNRKTEKELKEASDYFDNIMKQKFGNRKTIDINSEND